MKRLSIIIFSLYTTAAGFGQGIKKYDIGNSGCEAYFYCDPGTATVDYTPDSSLVYTIECINEQLHYGLICVKFISSITPVKEKEDLMIQYIDYLKDQFKIKESAGYGKGHTMDNYAPATGVIDFWKDDTGAEWKIKSWTDGYYIGFMYVYADGSLNSANISKMDLFLNGFRFPGM